jgi:hypothetical protein
MDDKDPFDPSDPGDREVERRLQAYADARLTPSVPTRTRTRAVVMAAADRRAALVGADATFDLGGPATVSRGSGRATTHRRSWRRPMVALAAAGLTLGMLAGTAFAARPGGPLYQARIWAELANLPTDVEARAKAEVQRLEARLEEAREAHAAGDEAALEAALEAYSSIVVEAAAGSRGDPAALATIEIGVTHHVAVLTSLADAVPAPAQSAIQHALSSSSKVLDDIGGTPPNGGGNGGTNGNGGPGGPAVNPTDKPGKPSPDEHGGPAETAKPDKPGQPDRSPGNPDHPDPTQRP